MSGFAKIYETMLDSSLWVSEDSDTRIVWVTLLAMARPDGLVECRAPGVAARSRVSLEKTREALEKFRAPDPDSRSQEHEGRRIEDVADGILILNFAKYRGKGGSAERMRRYRAGRSVTSRDVTPSRGDVTPSPVTQSDGPEAEAEADPKAYPKPDAAAADPKTPARVREEQPPCQPEQQQQQQLVSKPEEKPLPPFVSLPARREPAAALPLLYEFPESWTPNKASAEELEVMSARVNALGLTRRQTEEGWEKFRYKTFQAPFTYPHRQFCKVMGWHAKDLANPVRMVAGIPVPPPAKGSEHARAESTYRERRTEEPPRRKPEQEKPSDSEIAEGLARVTGAFGPKPPARPSVKRSLTAEEIEAELARAGGDR